MAAPIDIYIGPTIYIYGCTPTLTAHYHVVERQMNFNILNHTAPLEAAGCCLVAQIAAKLNTPSLTVYFVKEFQ